MTPPCSSLSSLPAIEKTVIKCLTAYPLPSNQSIWASRYELSQPKLLSHLSTSPCRSGEARPLMPVWRMPKKTFPRSFPSASQARRSSRHARSRSGRAGRAPAPSLFSRAIKPSHMPPLPTNSTFQRHLFPIVNLAITTIRCLTSSEPCVSALSRCHVWALG